MYVCSGRDFTIGKKLGGGNFGTVFEATLTDFGQMKVLTCFTNFT
jgi:hypothetical protein